MPRHEPLRSLRRAGLASRGDANDGRILPSPVARLARPPTVSWRAREATLRAEPIDQEPVAHTPVAHDQRGHPQLLHDRANDTRAREDHLGALRLEADDRATRIRVARSVELDLPVDLDPVQGRTLDLPGVIRREL